MATQVVEEIALSELHNTADKDIKGSAPTGVSSVRAKSSLLENKPNENELLEQPQPESRREIEYVHGFRLAILTISLMLGVFIIALDTTIIGSSPSPNIIKPSLTTPQQQQSPKSPQHSTASKTSVGTAAHTSSPSWPCNPPSAKSTPSSTSNTYSSSASSPSKLDP
jgi:hypothetical protein